jgi:hypothetical protein
MKRALHLIEQRFGDLSKLGEPSLSRRVISVHAQDRLTRNHLSDLFSHRALAIHVKQYYKCDAVLEMIENEQRSAKNWTISYKHNQTEESDVLTIGLPMNMAIQNDDLDAYYQESFINNTKFRNENLLSPIDKLRLDLDDLWDDGAIVAKSKEGKAHNAGLVRIMKRNSNKNNFLHVDDLSVISKDRGAFSANIYLKQPKSGGDLEIFPISLRSRLDFYKNAVTLSSLLMRDIESQAQLRALLPEPIVIKPEAGDLVMLCVQRPHAVKDIILGGERISMQSFINYTKGSPLQFDN